MELYEQLIGVVVVLGILAGSLWLLKQKGLVRATIRYRGAGKPPLELIDRLALTPHHSLHLVRLADRTILVGLSPNGCALLERLDRSGLHYDSSAERAEI